MRLISLPWLRLILALLPACLCGQSVSLPKADAPLPRIMLEWSEAQKSLPDMVVGFRQTRTIPALKQPVTSRGSFWRFQR